jgi:hypothetical protein
METKSHLLSPAESDYVCRKLDALLEILPCAQHLTPMFLPPLLVARMQESKRVKATEAERGNQVLHKRDGCRSKEIRLRLAERVYRSQRKRHAQPWKQDWSNKSHLLTPTEQTYYNLQWI